MTASHSIDRAARPAATAPQGCIDGIDGDTVVGWFAASGGGRDKLVVRVDGRPVATVPTSRARPDVAEKFGLEPGVGFACQLKDLPRDAVAEIGVVHEASGFDFHGERLKYCPAVARSLESLRRLFFAESYRHRYGFEAMGNAEAFEHYVRFGIYADFDPNPWFSSAWVREHHGDLVGAGLPIIAYLEHERAPGVRASALFDPGFYASANPDLGRADGLLEHYASRGHRQGRNGFANRVPEAVRHEIGALAQLEPDIGHLGGALDRVVRYPRLTVGSYVPALAKRRFPERPAVVICVPYLATGGADLIATYVLRAMQQAHGPGRVVLLVTDRPENSVQQWLDSDTDVVFLDEDGRMDDFDERVEALHALIGYLAPDKIVNVNSHACWAMYLHFGRQLSSVTELLAYLFCFDHDVHGQIAGYIRDFVPRSLPYLKTVFCDNATIIESMRELYGFPDRLQERFHCVYVPAPEGLAEVVGAGDPANASKPILWVGRLARQKRPELLVEIARRMPGHRFVAYGPPGDAGAGDLVTSGEIPNIEYRGVFGDVAELDLSEFSMYLNTSAWEGLPTIIIQLMSTGLPIVTSNVGGISELVGPETGWLVPSGHDPESYATEMKQVILNPDVVRQRSVRGREVTASRHVWEAFRGRLAELGAFEVPARREPVDIGSGRRAA